MSETSKQQPSGARHPRGVLVADLGGVIRGMGDDEARAGAAIARIREVFSSVVPRHGGTLDVLIGDCFVAIFEGPVEAVRAAVAVQSELAGTPVASVHLRIGLHMGDIVRSGSQILGDGVTIATRLQALARPGGIVLSEDVYRAVRNRVSLPFRDLGMKALKNVREPVHAYEINLGDAAVSGATGDGWSLRAVAAATLGIVVIAGLAALGYRYSVQPTSMGVASVANVPTKIEASTPVSQPNQLLSVGVTGVTTHGDVPQWMQDNTRDGLNTVLSKVSQLRVFSREKIDFLRQRRGLSEIEVAETLGIQKMISGSLTIDGADVVVEVRIVDTATGILDSSESARGRPDDLIELQNKLANNVFSALRINLSADERDQLFARRTKETLDGYRRLADTFGEATGGGGIPPEMGKKTSWIWPARAAWAEDPPTAEPEGAIRTVLEAYRSALEHEDIEGVAAIHLEFNAEQRQGFERYFTSAEGLKVTLSNIDILLDGDEALATFTRRDVFHDQKSGKEVELEVRLSSEVVKKGDRWLMRGVKRSS